MKTLLENLNYQPHTLINEEIETPESVLAHFFFCHELHTTRAQIQEFYHAWQNIHAEAPDGQEIKNMVFFFEGLIDLVNASYVIGYKHENKQDGI